MKSIKSKLIIQFSILLLIFFSIYSAVTYITVTRTLTTQSDNNLASRAEDSSKLVSSFVESQIKEMNTLGSVINLDDQDKLSTILLSETKRLKYNMIIVCDLKGVAKLPTGGTTDISSRDYFKKAVKGEANMSNPMKSVVKGEENKLVLVVAVPIIRNGQTTGVLVGQLNGDYLTSFANESKFGSTGYAYIIDNTGTIISHVNTEYVSNMYNPVEEAKKDNKLKDMKDLLSKAINNESSIGKYTFNSTSTYAACAPVAEMRWSVVVSSSESEIMQPLTKFAIYSSVLFILIIILGILTTYIIGSRISKPIQQLSHFAKLVASLDVSKDIPAGLLKHKDEIGILSHSFQSLSENIREFISNVNNSADHAEAASHKLSEITNETASSSEDVAKVIEEIAKGADEQSTFTQKGADIAQRLGDIIEKDIELLDKLNSSYSNVVSIVGSGIEDVAVLAEKTRETDSACKEIFQSILRTNESSSNIDQASQVIASIAEQTNLLALNAAIEAARAGESGKGFAVVADEIRKLSEQSTASTKQIDKMVRELLENSSQTVEIMHYVDKVISEQTDCVEMTQSKYNSIADAMTESTENITSMTENGKDLDEKKNTIMDIMENLAAIAEENAASTEEASASVEEQSASVEEISSSSEKLNSMVSELKEQVAKFKI